MSAWIPLDTFTGRPKGWRFQALADDIFGVAAWSRYTYMGEVRRYGYHDGTGGGSFALHYSEDAERQGWVPAFYVRARRYRKQKVVGLRLDRIVAIKDGWRDPK